MAVEPPAQGWTDPRVRPAASELHGSGLISSAPVHEGEVLFIWSGDVIDDAELQRIAASGKLHSSVAIGEDRNLLFGVVDPTEVGVDRGTGGLNHSCDPNLWLLDAFRVCARRDIAAGEELTLDYALCTVSSGWHIDPCACGSRVCRGRVTGDDWQRKDLQRRYAGHFSPFINQRIAREPT